MSEFVDLCYESGDGLRAPVDPDVPDNPYRGSTELARKILANGMHRLGWTYRGTPMHVRFQSRVICALDVVADLVVVVLHFSDPQYKRPSNAVVVSASGKIDHQIDPPKFVRRLVEQRPDSPTIEKYYVVEGMKSVESRDARILIDLNFNYEWVEKMYYDTRQRQWAESAMVHRQ
jgi:hypothetical protein